LSVLPYFLNHLLVGQAGQECFKMSFSALYCNTSFLHPLNRVLNLGPEIKRYAMSMEHSKNVLSMVVGQLAKHGLHYHMPGWKRK
jgi:hypothetical protein